MRPMFSLPRAVAGLVLTGCLAGATPAEEWRPDRLWVCGSQSTLWVVGAGGASPQAFPIVQMWTSANPETAPIAPTLQLPAVSGSPHFVTADTEALRILYADLTAYDYSLRRPAAAGALWRDQCRARPLAWAGDALRAELWAVVRTDDLTIPVTSRARSDDASPAQRITLLRLRNGRWNRTRAPAQSGAGEAYWLAVRDADVLLFWRQQGRIHASARRGAEWGEPVSVVDQPVRWACAGFRQESGVFIAGEPAPDGRVRLRMVFEEEGGWAAAGEVREGNEFLHLRPDTSAAAIVADKLVIARPTEAGAEIGVAPLDSSPSPRFQALPVAREVRVERSPWEESLLLGLLLGVVTVSLWARRDEVGRVIELPAGCVLAAVWRRALATIVDFLPAVMIMSPWWYPRVAATMLQYGPDIPPERMAELDSSLRGIRVATVLVYGLWCLLWETVLASTPGKLLFACRVMSAAGGPPTPGQCLVRNALRVMMVGMEAPGLLVTAMTMLIISRNRQRVGDLLARTVVVEGRPGVPAERDVERGHNHPEPDEARPCDRDDGE
jgi:uncharacterized RDD family membrane protein YckC